MASASRFLIRVASCDSADAALKLLPRPAAGEGTENVLPLPVELVEGCAGEYVLELGRPIG